MGAGTAAAWDTAKPRLKRSVSIGLQARAASAGQGSGARQATEEPNPPSTSSRLWNKSVLYLVTTADLCGFRVVRPARKETVVQADLPQLNFQPDVFWQRKELPDRHPLCIGGPLSELPRYALVGGGLLLLRSSTTVRDGQEPVVLVRRHMVRCSQR